MFSSNNLITYYEEKLKNNSNKRKEITYDISFGGINLPIYQVFNLVSDRSKLLSEKYVCYDFVIEFLKKYSKLDNFKTPRKELDTTPNKNTFLKNFKSFFSFSNSKKNIQETKIPTNFGIINYYNNYKLVHTGVLIQYNSNFYVISKFGFGNLYLHKIEDVPDSYGNKIKFFELINNVEFQENKTRLSAMIINHISKKGYFEKLEK